MSDDVRNGSDPERDVAESSPGMAERDASASANREQRRFPFFGMFALCVVVLLLNVQVGFLRSRVRSQARSIENLYGLVINLHTNYTASIDAATGYVRTQRDLDQKQTDTIATLFTNQVQMAMTNFFSDHGLIGEMWIVPGGEAPRPDGWQAAPGFEVHVDENGVWHVVPAAPPKEIPKWNL